MTDQLNGQEIIEKIKEAHIKPRPKWEFLLKNYVIWALFIIEILVGSLSFGVVVFMCRNTDWQYYAEAEGLIQKILINLPYFWLLLLIAFGGIAFYNLRHTKKGYLYNPLLVVFISIMTSIILGSAIYAFGGGEKLEDIFYRRVPFYQKIIRFHGRMLFAPKQGRIPGVVVEIEQNNITIMDFQGNLWNIATSTDQFVIGQRVIIHGQPPINDEFKPRVIKPWIRPNHFMPKPCPGCIRP